MHLDKPSNRAYVVTLERASIELQMDMQLREKLVAKEEAEFGPSKGQQEILQRTGIMKTSREQKTNRFISDSTVCPCVGLNQRPVR